MPRFSSYLFRLSGVAFLAALFGLTGVIWITQALRDLDLLTAKGQTILVFLSVSAMVLPSLVMIVAPVALLAAILFTLNKLNSDSELISMSAAGLSPWQMTLPFAGLTLATTVFVGFMSLVAMPWGFAHLRDILMKVRADFLANLVIEGQFTTLDRGFVFHYRERAPGGGLRGIFIQDRRDPEHINTYLAEAGYTVEENGINVLSLEKGSIQRQQAGEKDPIMVVFDRYAIDLAQLSPSAEGIPLKPRERSTLALMEPNMDEPYVRANLGSLRAELHDRIVSPLYAMVFGMIAFAATGRVRTTRQSGGLMIVGAVLAALFIRLAGVGASSLAASYSWGPLAQYAIPVLGFAAAAWQGLGDPIGWLKQLFSSRAPQAAASGG